MDQITHEVRLANWKAIIEECQTRPKGQSQKQWLAEHEIPEKQYYYWLRKFRQTAALHAQTQLPAVQEQKVPAPAFVEIQAEQLLPEPVPMITIRTKKSTIEIPSTVPETLVIRLVKAVSHVI